jgi:V8-like Glu-specific endopeptidase
MLGVVAACGSPGTSVALSAGRVKPDADQSAQERLESAQVLRSDVALPPPGSIPTADAETEPLRVGALFAEGSHFCTASVVDSPRHDLLITAAHCIYPANGHGYVSGVTFVPGFVDGRRPYGTWTPKRLVVDRTWTTDSDPDLDVGFVVLKPLDGKNIQDILGGNRLAIGTGFTHLVRVTGYPSSSQQPVTCVNWSGQQNSTQLKFVCGGFSGGTSGSPWVTDFDPATATGTIVGVIGGFEEGGDTDSVSYSASFNNTVRRLYHEASG